MKKTLLSILFIPALALAQQPSDQQEVRQLVVATGGDEQVGPPEGETYAKYNITQSWELGYRFASVGGDDGKYRSDVNYGDGVRLLSSSLAIHSLEGHGNLFDEVTLTTTGLGNDPYQAVTFRVQKNRLYRYDMLWRTNDYFNPGLTVASGEHLEDTTQQWQDHDLTLFPQSAFRIHAGYAHTMLNGPALTTQEEYNAQGDVFPLFENIREQYNEYRLGFDAKFSKFRLTVEHQWEYFKQDSTASVATAETSGTPATTAVPATLTNYQADEPYRGRTPSWMGNLTGEFDWIRITAKATYSGGKGDFVRNEVAMGTNQVGAAQNEQIAVTGVGDRPVLTGDFNLTLFPSSRLTLVSNTSADNTRMTGDDAFTEFNDATLTSTTLNLQFLGILLVTNSTDLRYTISKKFDIFGGFRYADRQIRSIEDAADPGSPFGGLTAEQSNHTTAGVAGFNWLLFTGFRMHAEGEVGTNDHPFAPISQRNYHTIRTTMQYRRKSVSLGGSYLENYNSNSIDITSYSSHARSYSVNGSWAASSRMSFNASYSQLYLNTIGGLAFYAGDPTTSLVTGMESIYISNIHALNLAAHFTPVQRVDVYLGYSLTKDTGDGRDALALQATPVEQVLYDVQTFPLTYQTPLARLSVRLNAKLRWNAAYQYYGYHEEFGVLSQIQNYRAHTGYTSLLWSF